MNQGWENELFGEMGAEIMNKVVRKGLTEKLTLINTQLMVWKDTSLI